MQNVQYNTLMIQAASKHLKLEAIFGMSQDTDTHIFDCQKGLNQLEYLTITTRCYLNGTS